MIVFTEQGDTPWSITNRYLGHNDNDFVTRLKQANLNSFAWQMTNGAGYYSANRAIWLPLDNDFDPTTRDQIIRGFDFMPSDTRANLAKLQQAGVSHQTLLSVHAITAHANAVTSENKSAEGGVLSSTFEFASSTVGSVIDLKAEWVEKLTINLKAVKSGYEKFATAVTSAEQKQVVEEIKGLQKEVHRILPQGIDELNLRRNPYLRVNAPKIKANARRLMRQGWEIYDETVMPEVDEMGSRLKVFGRSFFWADATTSGVDVYDIYEAGGDWENEAVNQGVKLWFDYKVIPAATKQALKVVSKTLISDEVMAGLETAGIVALDFTPIGWVGTIGVALFEVGVAFGVGKLIDRAIS